VIDDVGVGGVGCGVLVFCLFGRGEGVRLFM